MLLKLSKMLLMNLTEEENLGGVSLLIDTGFCQISLGLTVFCKKI